MAFSGEKKSGRATLSEINVTPLVDVMLVLLIIFMVTTPLIQQGVKVDLPKARAEALETEQDKLILTVDRNRKIYIGKEEIELANLEEKIKFNARIQKEKELYLYADRKLPYGFIVEIMAITKRAGVEAMGMITDPVREIGKEDEEEN